MLLAVSFLATKALLQFITFSKKAIFCSNSLETTKGVEVLKVGPDVARVGTD
ncbi:hypothetical protein Hanom_Chr11g01000011 [Helianthus anomalus]